MDPIYFDYNATTPLDLHVAKVMQSTAERFWGNPSSIHRLGQSARAQLDDARYRLARAWKCRPSEIIFTSGGTEANNLAILGVARQLRRCGNHLVASSIEHPAVLEAVNYLEKHEGFSVTRLSVDSQGQVDPESLVQAIRPDTILVSVMTANNETGVLQPVDVIGKLCRERGIAFHTDAVQAFGKVPFEGMDQFQADLVSVCAHKFHGPKGVGALFVRSPLQLQAIQIGGAHENDRRAGTENLAAIIGLVEAFESMVTLPVFKPTPLFLWTDQIRTELTSLPGVQVHGHPHRRLPNTVCFTVDNSDSLILLANLDLAGICASSGSACSVGSLEPSHVLQAMGVSAARCQSLVRFSLGRENSPEEVARTLEILPDLLQKSRRDSII
jgi:cysteine desulfurase